MSKRKKKRKATTSSLRSNILTILRKNPKQSYNYKQILRRIGLADEESKLLIQAVLIELEEKEKIISVSRGKFKLKLHKETLEGIIDITSSGNAYVSIENYEEDIFIYKKNVPNVVSGDTVEVSIIPSYRTRKIEGEVTAVIERKTDKFTGRLNISNNTAFIILSSVKIHFDIYIPYKDVVARKLKEGLLVECKIEDWGNKKLNPSGKITEVLGYPGENDAEIYSILSEYNIERVFDEQIEIEAKHISSEISKDVIKSRRDFRKITTFTIDPFDAKDFDDALSVKQLNNQNWEIGIHIADVSHYVKKDSNIDKEAQERATSIYLVDRVIPMLPEVLSNNLCSLRPNEEKLCFSAVFELNNKAELIDKWFGKTIIQSDKRFTYEEAQKIIETKHGKFHIELNILNNLAKKLRVKRKEKGAISFNKVETKFRLDDQKNPTSIILKESKEAHKLIEEFMLLANRNVAEFIAKQSLPFVYRIHDTPNPEKLDILSYFLKGFGYNLQTENKNSISKSMNQILDDVKGKDEASMIETLSIRTMAKATYSTENIGHYGLAFNHYSHFTSPIRRYPDVIVHRLLQYYLDGGKKVNINEIEKQCKHCSEMEIVASKAERDSIKFMQAKYISQFIGQQMDGIISSVTDFGMFIELLDKGCEGLVKLKDIPGDFYYYDEPNFCIKGHSTQEVFRIGNSVKVKVRNVNLFKREIDLAILL
ncbi:MAG: ribonuclease R [Flavobacteriales bacterium]